MRMILLDVSPPRKRGSITVPRLVDSRLRGNDRGGAVGALEK
jgi:hypothetical protein